MASRITAAPHDDRPTFQEAAADLVNAPSTAASSTTTRWFLILGAFVVLGVVGFILKIADDGMDDRRAWGYYVAMVSFLLTTAGGLIIAIPSIIFYRYLASKAEAIVERGEVFFHAFGQTLIKSSPKLGSGD